MNDRPTPPTPAASPDPASPVWASDLAGRLDVATADVLAVLDLFDGLAAAGAIVERHDDDGGGRDVLIAPRLAAAVGEAVDRLAEPREIRTAGSDSAPVPTPRVTLAPLHDDELQSGRLWYSGTVAVRVEVDGRRIGWVGDGRLWRGHRWGARRWTCCHREEGDTAARWNPDGELPYRSRAAAVRALLDAAGVQR